MKTALTIAGSDASGGAGIQADIKTFQAHGVFGMSAVTAVTVQNTQKVFAVQEMAPDIVRDQILCLFDDIEIHAIKIGMVSSIVLIETIALALKQLQPRIRRPPVVLDPVMISKSGYALMEKDSQDALVQHLFPLAAVVTPNLHEAQVLTGIEIGSISRMKRAAERIRERGADKVVVKGGHLLGQATDIFYDGTTFLELEGRRIDTKNTHGTGCTFSSAIAANLALGKDMLTAVTEAKTYISGAIENSLSIGKGCGPTNHFFDLYARAGLRV